MKSYEYFLDFALIMKIGYIENRYLYFRILGTNLLPFTGNQIQNSVHNTAFNNTRLFTKELI